jgi:hypothetical protein
MTRRSRLDIRGSLSADGGVPSDGELARWPTVDVLALAPQRRELYLRREQAIRLYLNGASDIEIRAEWSDTDSYVMWDRCAWLARVTPDALRLVAAPPEVWETAPRSPKPERCSAYLQALEHRRDVALAGCPCLCLTWLGDAGWTVRAVYKPADLDLRRRRVLGFKNKRLWCWIYRTDDKVFAARLAGARLQTTGTTPGAAITALRRSAAVYQRICNVDLPHTRPSLLIHPEPMDPMLANRYRELVADVQHFGGFWRAGPELADSARRYQRAKIRGAWRA